ncbi:MOSC domain-containing protein [Marivita sp. S2033]|uniref:MOSC domain-containing protein n=1 Tax=Marivita sp. S2033 TaxID=3373187 RepID=UPI00398231E5
MTAHITEIWRHPIKSHGRESLQEVMLEAGKAMPFDRLWAVAHERSTVDGMEWASCGNFCRVAKIPALMAITASYDVATGQVTLCHPNKPDLTFDPDKDQGRFLEWVKTLSTDDALTPARIVRAQGPAFTDSEFPSVTLCNHGSHSAVEHVIGKPLSRQRWRGNIWIDGIDAWDEFAWEGHEVQLGHARMRVLERTERCKSTHSNPETGVRDADVLGALESLGHRDFSVRAEVIEGGLVSIGDEVSHV